MSILLSALTHFQHKFGMGLRTRGQAANARRPPLAHLLVAHRRAPPPPTPSSSTSPASSSLRRIMLACCSCVRLCRPVRVALILHVKRQLKLHVDRSWWGRRSLFGLGATESKNNFLRKQYENHIRVIDILDSIQLVHRLVLLILFLLLLVICSGTLEEWLFCPDETVEWLLGLASTKD